MTDVSVFYLPGLFVVTTPPTERRETDKGVIYTAFGAVQNRYVVEGANATQHDQWVNIVCFEAQVETALSLRKGDVILVSGRLKAREWTSKKTGKTGVSVEISAHLIQPLLSQTTEVPF